MGWGHIWQVTKFVSMSHKINLKLKVPLFKARAFHYLRLPLFLSPKEAKERTLQKPTHTNTHSESEGRRMERYQRVEKPKPEQPINENEIRVTAQGLIRNYVTYATSLFQVFSYSHTFIFFLFLFWFILLSCRFTAALWSDLMKLNCLEW